MPLLGAFLQLDTIRFEIQLLLCLPKFVIMLQLNHLCSLVVTSETFFLASANITNDAHLEIKNRGFWRVGARMHILMIGYSTQMLQLAVISLTLNLLSYRHHKRRCQEA